MSHEIAEAIIEDGRIQYVDRQLPSGRLKVHLIYDTDALPDKDESLNVLRETAGVYYGIDAQKTSQDLRNEWERNHGR